MNRAVVPSSTRTQRDPRVSVVMPFLNAQQFIQEAIDSVRAQTYSSWELLLVDDGSSDGSTEIALRYAGQYPRQIRYLVHDGHENRGISASLNRGIHHAAGEYIALLDADDVWLPQKLEQQVVILDSYPEVGMLYGAAQYWYSWTGKPEDRERDCIPQYGVQPNTLLQPPKLLTLFLQGAAPVPCPCSVLLRRKVIGAITFEESFRRIFTDQVFYAKVCLKVPVFVSSECWARYRKHPASSCAVVGRTGQLNAARLIFLDWLAKYLTQQGVDDPEIWHALRHKQRRHRHLTLYRLLERARHPVAQIDGLSKLIARRILPPPIHSWLKVHWSQVGSSARQ